MRRWRRFAPRLLPVDDDLDTGGFFEAARRGELAVRRCNGCDAVLHVPRMYCRHCGSWNGRWQPVDGAATLLLVDRRDPSGAPAYPVAVHGRARRPRRRPRAPASSASCHGTPDLARRACRWRCGSTSSARRTAAGGRARTGARSPSRLAAGQSSLFSRGGRCGRRCRAGSCAVVDSSRPAKFVRR